MYRDYFINHDIRIPIKQPVFHGTRIRPFLFESKANVFFFRGSRGEKSMSCVCLGCLLGENTNAFGLDSPAMEFWSWSDLMQKPNPKKRGHDRSLKLTFWPLNIWVSQKERRKGSSSNHPFSGAMFVLGRVHLRKSIWFHQKRWFGKCTPLKTTKHPLKLLK